MTDFSSGLEQKHIDSVARDEVTAWKFERKFATANVGTAEQPIWEGGATYEFVDVPETIDVASDNINDTLAGTGAQKIKIIGLNAGVITTETLDLNGTTTVQTANQYDFIYRMIVIQAGATTPVIAAISKSVGAAGTITATGATTSAVRAVIVGNAGSTLQTPIRVPAGEEWQIHDVTTSAGKGSEVTLRSYVRLPGTQIFLRIAEGQLVESGLVILAHRKLPAGTDLIFTGQAAAGTVQVSILVQMTRKGATEDLI